MGGVAGSREAGRSRLPAAADRGAPVGYATLARGDVVEIDGRRRRIATIVQQRSGFVVQFADTTTGPPQRIDRIYSTPGIATVIRSVETIVTDEVRGSSDHALLLAILS